MLTINVPKIIMFCGLVVVNAFAFHGLDCIMESYSNTEGE